MCRRRRPWPWCRPPPTWRAWWCAQQAADSDSDDDRLLRAALHASTVRSERGELLAALGAFRQPDLARQARAVLLQPQIDLRDSLPRVPGGRAALARTLEAVQLCTAWRAHHGNPLP